MGIASLLPSHKNLQTAVIFLDFSIFTKKSLDQNKVNNTMFEKIKLSLMLDKLRGVTNFLQRNDLQVEHTIRVVYLWTNKKLSLKTFSNNFILACRELVKQYQIKFSNHDHNSIESMQLIIKNNHLLLLSTRVAVSLVTPFSSSLQKKSLLAQLLWYCWTERVYLQNLLLMGLLSLHFYSPQSESQSYVVIYTQNEVSSHRPPSLIQGLENPKQRQVSSFCSLSFNDPLTPPQLPSLPTRACESVRGQIGKVHVFFHSPGLKKSSTNSILWLLRLSKVSCRERLVQDKMFHSVGSIFKICAPFLMIEVNILSLLSVGMPNSDATTSPTTMAVASCSCSMAQLRMWCWCSWRASFGWSLTWDRHTAAERNTRKMMIFIAEQLPYLMNNYMPHKVSSYKYTPPPKIFIFKFSRKTSGMISQLATMSQRQLFYLLLNFG